MICSFPNRYDSCLLNVRVDLWNCGTVDVGAICPIAHTAGFIVIFSMVMRVAFSMPVCICGTVERWKRGLCMVAYKLNDLQ